MSKVEFNATIPVPIKFGQSSVVNVEELVAFGDALIETMETAKALARKVPRGFTNKQVGITIPYYESNQFKIRVTAEEPKEEEELERVDESPLPDKGYATLERLILDFPRGVRISYNGRQGPVVGYRTSRFNDESWWLMFETSGKGTSFMADPQKATILSREF